jgi:hypothetical protein
MSSDPAPNILTYIRSAYNLDKIPSENIHITISDEDVFIHIKVNEAAAPVAATAGGGTLKKKRSLKSTKKTKTGPLSDQQIHHKEHKDPTADE